jgi:hypothetical protein
VPRTDFDHAKTCKRVVGFVGGSSAPKRDLGQVRVGAQYEFVKLQAFAGSPTPSATNGTAPNMGPPPYNNIVFFSLRYYPFNRFAPRVLMMPPAEAGGTAFSTGLPQGRYSVRGLSGRGGTVMRVRHHHGHFHTHRYRRDFGRTEGGQRPRREDDLEAASL